MRKVPIKFKLAWSAAMASLVTVIVYSIPLVKYLIWLNAAAVSTRWNRPGLFVWLALGEVSFIMGIVGLGFWKLANSIWE